jgi:hypothetical protein
MNTHHLQWAMVPHLAKSKCFVERVALLALAIGFVLVAATTTFLGVLRANNAT